MILFLYEIDFYMKNAFFWCIICWCRSKIVKFWNFAHFLAIFSTFSIFAIFLWFVEKNIWKRLKSVGNDPNLCENMNFDLFVALEPRKRGGGFRAPPAPGKASWTSPLLGLRLLKKIRKWAGAIHILFIMLWNKVNTTISWESCNDQISQKLGQNLKFLLKDNFWAQLQSLITSLYTEPPTIFPFLIDEEEIQSIIGWPVWWGKTRNIETGMIYSHLATD